MKKIYTFPTSLSSDLSNKYKTITIQILKSEFETTNAQTGYDEGTKKLLAVMKGLDRTPADSSGDFESTINNIKIKQEKLNEELNTGVKEICNIVLPIPNNLENSHQHEWNKSKGLASTLGDKIFGSLGTKASNFTSAISGATSMLADSLSIRKPILDPAYYQSYEGSSPRTFSFSFDLMPANVDEAREIIMILMTLRKYSLPTALVNHMVLQAPYYFDIYFSNPTIDVLMNIKGVVLTSIRTNYSGDGQMQMTADGMPKSIKLDLTFAERRMSISEYYPI